MQKTVQTSRRKVRQIERFIKGTFGPDDGSFKNNKTLKELRKLIKKEDLEESYIQQKDLL